MQGIALPLLGMLFGATQVAAVDVHRTVSSFVSSAGKVEMEEYASSEAMANVPAIVMLSGSGGVHSLNMPFDSQARLFAGGGYRVYIPHYLDATHGSARDPIRHYAIWAQAVRDALSFIQVQAHIARQRIALVGYSLGASVALAAAAGESRPAGVVVWSGSLPDAYLDTFDGLTPLLILHGARDNIIAVFNATQLAKLCELKHGVCKLSIYAEEGHAFGSAGIGRADREIGAFLEAIFSGNGLLAFGD